jgi:hypothetical protein
MLKRTDKSHPKNNNKSLEPFSLSLSLSQKFHKFQRIEPLLNWTYNNICNSPLFHSHNNKFKIYNIQKHLNIPILIIIEILD